MTHVGILTPDTSGEGANLGGINRVPYSKPLHLNMLVAAVLAAVAGGRATHPKDVNVVHTLRIISAILWFCTFLFLVALHWNLWLHRQAIQPQRRKVSHSRNRGAVVSYSLNL